MENGLLPMPEVVAHDSTKTLWFAPYCCVRSGPELTQVFVGGYLVGEYATGNAEGRNRILVTLSNEGQFRKGRLAQAFGVTPERVRQLRGQFERQGWEGLTPGKRGGSASKLDAKARRRLYREFDMGITAGQAFRASGEKLGVSLSTIQRVHFDWKVQAQQTEQHAEQQASAESAADQLPLVVEGGEELLDDSVITVDGGDGDDSGHRCDGGENVPIPPAPVKGRRQVLHAGSWLLIAVVHALGLHKTLLGCWKAASNDWRARLRVALDAVIVALGIGQKCVEGVRRIAHPSAPTLLRSASVPGSSWVRRLFKRYLKEAGSVELHLGMLRAYLERHQSQADVAAVFYIDNHMRPYTGKRRLQRGWRMQDKRVRKGTTDYYVHDEDGRPLFRVDVPMHSCLGDWLHPITELLRQSLGPDQRILLAFDRGGAFPVHLQKLRQRGFEFVTYERGDYPRVPEKDFIDLELDGGDTLGVHEETVELGKGNKAVEVRRLSLLTDQKRQVNVVAVSQESTERLIEIITGRWVQENAFKHSAQRWGGNQLDRRKTVPYPPTHILVNPYRKRVEQALRVAIERDGRLRRKIANTKTKARRDRLKEELKELIGQQKALEAERDGAPSHVMLKDSDLEGKLEYIDTHYKTVLDTIRIACINAESELAGMLRPYLDRPREAKMVLQNLFKASGSVRITETVVTVDLDVVGTKAEQWAIGHFLRRVNALNLTLPGDAKERPLRFRSQIP